MRRVGLVGLACLFVVAGLLVVAAPAQAYTVICSAKSKKQIRACDTSGYAEEIGTMHWRMYSGHNCTNYAAFRMQQAGVPEPTILMGNASGWAANARKLGYTVNKKPAVGSIAHWKAANHVGYVEEVGDGYLVISDDSWGSKVFRRYRVLPTDSWYPERFIHFQPTSQDPPPASTAPAAPAAATVAVSGPKKTTTRKRATVKVRVTSATGVAPEGRVRVRRGGRTVATATLTAQSAGLATVKLPKMARGKQWISAVFDGGAAVSAGTSAVIRIDVRKPPKVVASTTTVTLPATSVAAGRRPVATVAIRARDGRAIGNAVSVYLDGQRIAARKLTKAKKGVVRVRLPALTPGRHTITATYWGSKTVRRSQAAPVTLTVS